MIVRVTFEDNSAMMFGTSYKPWDMQMEEFMYRCAEGLKKPVTAEKSRSKWVAWGGLKWCPENKFQQQLNREGCQSNEPDNPKPRKYADMRFRGVTDKEYKKVMDAWRAGQRMLKINALSDEEYKQYRRGELKIEIAE